MAIEASYYEKRADQKVRCHLCPHECLIPPGHAGLCAVRRNDGGVLMALTYGRVSSVAMDPIEKKPLYHFHPGAEILSIGTVGCTFHCRFCQNWQLLDPSLPQHELPPRAAVDLARSHGSVGIAYTYNEPFASFEFVLAMCRLARQAGIKNVLVTNGFYMPEPWAEMAGLVDAMNIDLKAMSDTFYHSQCRGRVDPVLRTIRDSVQRGIHVELTNLLVTGLNDSEEQIRALVDFVADVGPDVPLHFSRYHPAYRMDRPATPAASLELACRIAGEKLRYVYLGNVAGMGGSDTKCPNCGKVVVERAGYSTRVTGLRGNRCAGCGQKLNFVV